MNKILVFSSLAGLALMSAAHQGKGAVVSLPFTDDFNDVAVGPWVHSGGGTWNHTGTVLNYLTTAGVDGSSVETPGLGGSNKVDFTVSQTVQLASASGPVGFGLMSSGPDFAAPNNSYYLFDLHAGTIRFAEIQINGSGGVALGDTGLLTEGGLTISSQETYTMTVAVAHGATDITFTFRVTSDGGDDITLVATDSTPLSGTHNGIETFGAGNTASFDNFSIVPVPEPSAPVLIGLGSLLLASLVRRRK